MSVVLVKGVPEAAPTRPQAIHRHILEQLPPVLFAHRAVYLCTRKRRSHSRLWILHRYTSKAAAVTRDWWWYFLTAHTPGHS
jgi:hypothetical protein